MKRKDSFVELDNAKRAKNNTDYSDASDTSSHLDCHDISEDHSEDNEQEMLDQIRQHLIESYSHPVLTDDNENGKGSEELFIYRQLYERYQNPHITEISQDLLITRQEEFNSLGGVCQGFVIMYILYFLRGDDHLRLWGEYYFPSKDFVDSLYMYHRALQFCALFHILNQINLDDEVETNNRFDQYIKEHDFPLLNPGYLESEESQRELINEEIFVALEKYDITNLFLSNEGLDAHAIGLIRVKADDLQTIGYKIFDPNFGEFRFEGECVHQNRINMQNKMRDLLKFYFMYEDYSKVNIGDATTAISKYLSADFKELDIVTLLKGLINEALYARENFEEIIEDKNRVGDPIFQEYVKLAIKEVIQETSISKLHLILEYYYSGKKDMRFKEILEGLYERIANEPDSNSIRKIFIGLDTDIFQIIRSETAELDLSVRIKKVVDIVFNQMAEIEGIESQTSTTTSQRYSISEGGEHDELGLEEFEPENKEENSQINSLSKDNTLTNGYGNFYTTMAQYILKQMFLWLEFLPDDIKKYLMSVVRSVTEEVEYLAKIHDKEYVNVTIRAKIQEEAYNEHHSVLLQPKAHEHSGDLVAKDITYMDARISITFIGENHNSLPDPFEDFVGAPLINAY